MEDVLCVPGPKWTDHWIMLPMNLIKLNYGMCLVVGFSGTQLQMICCTRLSMSQCPAHSRQEQN